MAAGERDARFREFVEARWPALVRFGYVLTGDAGHAEDLVQHALERCWRRWGRIEADSPERYVKAAMANLSASRWRRRRFDEVELADGHALPVGGGEESHAVRDLVWREIQLLPPRMRAVLVLRWLEDMTEAETAAALGCSVGSVKSQASRAMARLRERGVLAEATGRAPIGGTSMQEAVR
jgi:RNA polymerase sigma-70 factor (sigma-E family)